MRQNNWSNIFGKSYTSVKNSKRSCTGRKPHKTVEQRHPRFNHRKTTLFTTFHRQIIDSLTNRTFTKTLTLPSQHTSSDQNVEIAFVTKYIILMSQVTLLFLFLFVVWIFAPNGLRKPNDVITLSHARIFYLACFFYWRFGKQLIGALPPPSGLECRSKF